MATNQLASGNEGTPERALCRHARPHRRRPAATHRHLGRAAHARGRSMAGRSEEHTSELQSLMRISYAVFCLIKKTITNTSLAHTVTYHTLHTTLPTIQLTTRSTIQHHHTCQLL